MALKLKTKLTNGPFKNRMYTAIMQLISGSHVYVGITYNLSGKDRYNMQHTVNSTVIKPRT